MSSFSRSSASRLARAEHLKRELAEFVTNGDLKDEFELQRQLFFDATKPNDQHDSESVLDWFLYDWVGEDGECVVVRYLESKPELSAIDREILLDWLDSLNSVFEVRATNRNSIQLTDLDGDETYEVTTRQEETFKRGQYIIARLLPLGDDLIFSGLQFLMPDRESALAWLEMRQAIDQIDSPEAVENAQKEQVKAFCELFGCDELTVSSRKLNSTLKRFQQYLLRERRDPETGMTAAELFKRELGEELIVPDYPDLNPFTGAAEITILCDDFDGIVLLPDFTRFKRIFENDEPQRFAPDWRDLVWNYIKNPDIPIVAFERVAEDNPRRVEKVLRSLIGDKDFSLEHMYAVLLHYKQPIDGFEDLKDDQQLWDLFNGNPKTEKSKNARSASRKPKAGTKAAAKKTPASKTNRAAKKSVSARSTAAKRTSSVKRKPLAKASKPATKKTAAKASASTTKRSVKKSAKKR